MTTHLKEVIGGRLVSRLASTALDKERAQALLDEECADLPIDSIVMLLRAALLHAVTITLPVIINAIGSDPDADWKLFHDAEQALADGYTEQIKTLLKGQNA